MPKTCSICEFSSNIQIPHVVQHLNDIMSIDNDNVAKI